MSTAPREAYPLTWPSGRVRTPAGRRKFGQFKATLSEARDSLIAELRRLGVRNLIISSDLRVKANGLPYADAKEPADPGVAVYFNRGGRAFVLACDTYNKAWKNLRAIGATVEALRAIERHGSSEMLEQAFTGFAALPAARAAEPSWWDTLQVSREATLDQIVAAHLALVARHHPDIGGDHDAMARINRARDVAREELTARGE